MADAATPPRRRAAPDGELTTTSLAGFDANWSSRIGAAASAGAVALDVVVRDPAGRPVPGVLVSARSRHESDSQVELDRALDAALNWRRPQPAERAPAPTTDGAGRIRVLADPATGPILRIESDAWSGQTALPATLPRVPDEVLIEAVPAFRLSGRVVHEDGTPVSGATVFLSVPLPGRAPRAPRSLQTLKTRRDGRFSCALHPVPPTRWIECYLMGATMAGNEHRLLARQGAMADVELVAPRGTTVRGRCVDESGSPLEGVRVRGFRPRTGELTYTGVAGRFEIPVPAAGGSLVFFLDGRVQTALRDLRGPPEGVDVGDVLIPRGGSIAGRVVDTAGQALAGMQVQIFDPWTEHTASSAMTALDGSFRATPIGAGEQVALVSGARPGEPDGVRCTFRFGGLRADTTDALVTVPPGAWARVEVRDPLSDEPAPFAIGVVTLTRDDGTDEIVLHHVFETEPRSAFDMQFPGPGAYVLEFELPVTGATERRRIDVGAAPLGTIALTPR